MGVNTGSLNEVVSYLANLLAQKVAAQSFMNGAGYATPDKEDFLPPYPSAYAPM